MREPELCSIEYCGFIEPRSPEELEFEILGLKTVISEAQKRISTLEQTSYLVKIKLSEKENDHSNS